MKTCTKFKFMYYQINYVLIMYMNGNKYNDKQSRPSIAINDSQLKRFNGRPTRFRRYSFRKETQI